MAGADSQLWEKHLAGHPGKLDFTAENHPEYAVVSGIVIAV